MRGLVAQRVHGMERRPVRDAIIPRAAHLADPIDAIINRPAVTVAGRDARNLIVGVGEAEVREHVGHVLVRVVVFELEVVGLAGPGRACGRRRRRRRGDAEAEGAGQVVPRVRGGAAGVAGDLAELDFEGGGGVEGGREEEEEGGEEAEGAHGGLLSGWVVVQEVLDGCMFKMFYVRWKCAMRDEEETGRERSPCIVFQEEEEEKNLLRHPYPPKLDLMMRLRQYEHENSSPLGHNQCLLLPQQQPTSLYLSIHPSKSQTHRARAIPFHSILFLMTHP